MLNPIDSVYKYEIKNNGLSGYIDNKECKFVIKQINDSNTNHYDLKTIITDIPLHKGALVQIKEKYYLVIDIDEQLSQSVYNKGTIRECFEMYSNIKDYDSITSDSIKFYGIMEIDNNVIDNTNGSLNIVSDKYSLICRESDVIDLNHYCIYKNCRYKVDSVNNTIDGLKLLKIQFKSIIQTEPTHTYTLELVENNGSLYEGASIKIVPICKKDGIEVKDATCNYTILDSSIATIDVNGNITGTKEGSTIIEVSWEGQKVNYTIEVKKANVYKLEVSPTNIELDAGKTKQLSIVCKENDIVVENPVYTIVSNNTDIATIEGNIITGINKGSTTITVNYETETVNINVNVKESVIEFKDIIITRESNGGTVWDKTQKNDVYLKKGKSDTLIISNKDGSNMNGRKFNFEWDEGDIFETVETTDNTIKILSVSGADDMEILNITEENNPNLAFHLILYSTSRDA
ncbi:UNVERIFIED_ORG: hypothetical protein B2H93_14855 [Clostridium botulinum]